METPDERSAYGFHRDPSGIEDIRTRRSTADGRRLRGGSRRLEEIKPDGRQRYDEAHGDREVAVVVKVLMDGEHQTDAPPLTWSRSSSIPPTFCAFWSRVWEAARSLRTSSGGLRQGLQHGGELRENESAVAWFYRFSAMLWRPLSDRDAEDVRLERHATNHGLIHGCRPGGSRVRVRPRLIPT